MAFATFETIEGKEVTVWNAYCPFCGTKNSVYGATPTTCIHYGFMMSAGGSRGDMVFNTYWRKSKCQKSGFDHPPSEIFSPEHGWIPAPEQA